MSLVDEARTVRQRIADRLAELEPLVREYTELKQLAAEMGVEQDLSRSSIGDRSPPRVAARPNRLRRAPASRDTRTPAANAGPHGELAQRVVDVVSAQPGKTVAEYASDLQMAQTALYRPIRQLTTSGAIVKRARQLYPG